MPTETGSRISVEPRDDAATQGAPGTELTDTERRRHERVPFAEPIRITASSLDLRSTEQAIDLSLGGLFYRTDTPPRVGTMMDVQLGVDEDGEPIHAKAKVVRTVPPLKELAVPAGAGLLFTELDERGRLFIENTVNRYNELHPRQPIRLPEPVEEAGPGTSEAPPPPSPASGVPIDLGRTTRSKLLETLTDEDLLDLCGDTSKFTERLRSRATEILRRRGVTPPA